MDLDMNEIGNQTVQLWDGTESPLSKFWTQGPLVLAFLRHYG